MLATELSPFYVQLRDLIEEIQPTSFTEVIAEYDVHFGIPVGCEASDFSLALSDLINAGYLRYTGPHSGIIGVYRVTGKLPPRTVDDQWDW